MSSPKDKFKMICCDRSLTLSNLFSIDEENLIFDIGANDGTSALEFLEAFPKSNIVAIEPSQKAFSALEIRLISLSRVRIEEFALSDKCGKQNRFGSNLN